MPTFSRLARIAIRSFLPLLILASASAWSARETRWTFVPLNAPSANFTLATGVNNHGEVAGWFNVACPERGTCELPYVWEDGAFQVLPTPEDVTQVRVRGINDRGTVVGNTTLFGLEAIAWKDGEFTRLGFEGEAIRINRAGDIACTTRVGSLQRGCLLRNGVLYEFGTFGGQQSGAMELNDRGQLVGTADLANGDRRAFVWTNGTMTNLGTLGGSFSFGNSINDRGVAVGYSQDASGQIRAFEWRDGTMTAIPGLSAPSSAWGINDRGAIIGRMGEKAFLVDDGVLTILDDLPAVKAAGFTGLFATDINEHGWIVGFANTSSGVRGFLLIPR